MNYICIPKQKNRSFNKKKALEFGLKPGPIFGKLSKGESVTLKDGRVITIPNEEELSTVIGVDIFVIFIFIFVSLFVIFL